MKAPPADGIALVFRLWRMQQRPSLPEEPVVQYYLPPQSSADPLPVLKVSKKKPRQ